MPISRSRQFAHSVDRVEQHRWDGEGFIEKCTKRVFEFKLRLLLGTGWTELFPYCVPSELPTFTLSCVADQITDGSRCLLSADENSILDIVPLLTSMSPV
jgi:hypothetical protein